MKPTNETKASLQNLQNHTDLPYNLVIMVIQMGKISTIIWLTGFIEHVTTQFLVPTTPGVSLKSDKILA